MNCRQYYQYMLPIILDDDKYGVGSTLLSLDDKNYKNGNGGKSYDALQERWSPYVFTASDGKGNIH